MIKASQLQLSTRQLKAIATKSMKKTVANIKAGRVIKRKYADSTKRKRRKYGLKTSKVDLTGNRGYSGKSWRLLNSWKVVSKGPNKVSIVWTRVRAATIYSHLTRLYGRVIRLK